MFDYDKPGNVIVKRLQVKRGAATGSLTASFWYNYTNNGRLQDEYYPDPNLTYQTPVMNVHYGYNTMVGHFRCRLPIPASNC